MKQSTSFTAYAGRLLDFIQRSSSHEASLGDSHDEDFNHLALELFKLQFLHVEPYRRLCESRAIGPDTVGQWTEIPSVPTSTFKEFEFTSLAPSERTNVFHSSGTTEQRPSRHYHNAASLDVYEASLKPWFTKHLLDDSEESLQMIFLTPPSEQAPHSSLVHMLQAVGTAFGGPGSYFAGSLNGDQSWVLDGQRVFASLHDATLAARPLMLLGTAFSFVHLLDEFTAKNLRLNLPAGSRVMETGGYKGRSRQLPKSELHDLIQKQLGVPRSHIICEYGMSELSSQAYAGRIQHEGTESSLNFQPPFAFPPWARTLVISPETNRPVAVGEPGLLRIIDLTNVRSVLAVQTEDMAIHRERGFDLLGRRSLSEPRGCSLMTS